MDTAQYWFQAASDYQIERSLRFNSADSAYLNRTPASAGNRRTFTISYWIKRSALLPTSGGNPQYLFSAGSGTSESTWFQAGVFEIDSLHNETNLATWTTNALITPKFRDTSAWYHFVWSIDTTQASASNRVKVWVNGIEQPKSTPTISQNADLAWNNNVVHYIGARIDSGPRQFADCYLAEVYNIDGQALTPSSFGETDPVTGVWQPKKYDGTYGTNGFYLNFADNSGTTSTTLGKDSSGNGNNWTPNNFSVTAGAGNDSMIDVPTPYADGGNGRGNYCTANPINSNASTLRNGNLEFIGDTGASLAKGILGTIGVSSGKWYFEVTPDSGGTFFIGVAPANGVGVGSVDLEYINGAYSYRGNGDKCQGTGGTGTFTAYGSSYVSPDVIGVALDLDNGAIYFAKNNTWQNSGVPTSGSSKTGAAFTSFSGSYTPMACGFSGATATLNFGQRPFAYTPPSGFLALNTQNLPEPTIKKPSSYMDVVTYTGTGSAMTPTSSLGFSPDLVWIKSRSAATDHALYDAVRGTEKRLESNNTDAEVTSDGGVTAFNSAGFTLGTLAQVNTNTATYTAWCWDESATPGFDIVTYTGTGVARTIAHSLGVAPSMIIAKCRSTANDWAVYHSANTAAPETDYLLLNSTAATADDDTYWSDAAPTSSVFSIGTNVDVNANTSTYVAYLWSEVAGFSKFGSYTGNGSADGPFVHLGFKPRWLMIKRSDSTESWLIFDTARETYNPTDDVLWANLSNAESANYTPQDFTSNGFKIRTSSASTNASGGTYIYAAFAETPFRYSLAR